MSYSSLTFGRIDHPTHLDAPVCRIALIVRVIHLAVQQFKDQRDAGVCRGLRDAAQCCGRGVRARVVIQPVTVAAEADQIGHVVRFCQRDILTQLRLKRVGVLTFVQSVFQRQMPLRGRDFQSIIFRQRPVFLRQDLDAVITRLRDGPHQRFRREARVFITPPANGLLQSRHMESPKIPGKSTAANRPQSQ